MSDKIYRVGILGTENSHAAAFADFFNGGKSCPDFQVTSLYALEAAPSEAIKAKYPDIEIFDSPEAMLGQVDCVMVTARHGKYHLPFALPFIEAGLPAFIDKPFTISPDDAKALLCAAKKANAPICGGSGCKYSDDLVKLRAELDGGEYGKVKSAVINFPCDLESVYGGLYFYASHLTEMTAALLGYGIEAVTAFEKNGLLTVVAGYKGFNAVMNFAKNGKYYAVVYCEKDIIVRPISIDGIYEAEATKFADMVRTGVSPLTEEQLTAPVYIMNAIERSLKSGKTEAITE